MRKIKERSSGKAFRRAANDTAPRVLVRTPLALDNGVVAEIVSFSGLSDEKEHIALIFPASAPQESPLVRAHSECLTGDVFHSARCDCGDQLAQAQDMMSETGGILLYLRQEGRGIGLYKKIEAYKLQQENGLDTFEANRHLGFEDDLRNFQVAAEMLQALGVERVRLLTNNPDKARSLTDYGITVDEIICTGTFVKDANRGYLQIKERCGHTLSLS